jgi:hypothetical protein
MEMALPHAMRSAVQSATNASTMSSALQSNSLRLASASTIASPPHFRRTESLSACPPAVLFAALMGRSPLRKKNDTSGWTSRTISRRASSARKNPSTSTILGTIAHVWIETPLPSTRWRIFDASACDDAVRIDRIGAGKTLLRLTPRRRRAFTSQSRAPRPSRPIGTSTATTRGPIGLPSNSSSALTCLHEMAPRASREAAIQPPAHPSTPITSTKGASSRSGFYEGSAVKLR